MHINRITAGPDEIRFVPDEPVTDHRVRVSLFPAAVGEEGEVCSITVTVSGDSFSIPRRLSGKDGLTCRCVLSDASGEVTGKKYVERIDGAPEPPVRNPGGKGVTVTVPEDVPAVIERGASRAAVFVNLADFLMLYPAGENTLCYRLEGKEYYIRKEIAEYTDRCIRPLTEAGIPVTLTLLNAREWLCTAGERLWNTVRHPGADEDAEYALFDTVRGTGCGYFGAFVSFLAERYHPYGMVIGCDVNTAAENAAAGEMPLTSFAESYVTALRVAYQYAAPHGVRIYAAVDSHFEARAGEEGHTYAGRDLLSALAGFCLLEGEVPFGVAAHPGGGAAAFARMLTDFLARPEMLSDGAPRPVILLEAATDEPLPDTVDGVFAPAEG